MSRIEAWLYSSGTAGVRSATQELTIQEGVGPVTTVLLPSPAVFTTALANLTTAANTAGLANTYAISWIAASQVVRIEATNLGAVNFTLAFVGNLHNCLGFATAAGYAGATSYTGDRARALGRFDSRNVICEGTRPRPSPTSVELQRYRMGRHRAVAWGNHDLVDVITWASPDASADYRASYCRAGRVRVYPTDVTAAYSATEPAGYLDGWVLDTTELETIGVGEGWTKDRLVLALPRVAPVIAAGSRVWSTLQWGWAPVYWLTIQGVDLLASEAATGLSAPAGYTEEAGALVIDDGASVGQRVERDAGLGVGYPLTFRLLDTAAVRALVRAPDATQDTVLAAAATAATATIEVNSTAGWAAADFAHIGVERFQIGALAAAPPRFTGCTRGTVGVAYAHQADQTAAARITDVPRYWRGRRVELWAAPVDPTGYAPGTTLAGASELLFRGTISAGPDRTGGAWQFEALSLDRLLTRPLSSALTGKITDAEVRVPAVPTWKITYQFHAYTSAGVLVWGPYDLVTLPMEADASGDMLSWTEITERITSSFVAAVAAAGAPMNLDVETILWKQTHDYGVPGLPPGKIPVQWQAGFVLATDVTIARVRYRVVSGGLVIEHNGWPPGGAVSGSPIWTPWYLSAFDKGISYPPEYAAVKLDDAEAADVPADGVLVVGEDVYTYDVVGSAQTTIFLSKLRTPEGQPPAESLAGKSCEIVRSDSGVMTEVLRRMLTSSGTAALRSATWDTLDQQQGYGLPETLIDVLGIGQVLGGGMSAVALEVAVAGQSAADVLCPLIALSGRALVARQVARDATGAADATHAYRITAIHTTPSGGTWAAEITDAEILASDPAAVEVRRLGDPPTRVRVALELAGSETSEILIVDRGREQAQAAAELQFAIPSPSHSQMVALSAIWSRARFASDQSAREVDLLTVPWIDAEIGDLVHVTSSHPDLVDLVTGAAGAFNGVARVIGSSVTLDTGQRRWTLLFGGHYPALTLCPSAEISAVSAAPPIVGSTIDVPIQYAEHWSRVLEQDGVLTLTLYDPGQAEPAVAWGYEIDQVTATGTVCRLRVAALLGGAVVPTVGLSRLTTPRTAGATAYQVDHLMHDGDGSHWGSG